MEVIMRVNTEESIATANAVHERFGSWEAAKKSSDFKDGLYIVRSKPEPSKATGVRAHFATT
jgi:hypothetical protein